MSRVPRLIFIWVFIFMERSRIFGRPDSQHNTTHTLNNPRHGDKKCAVAYDPKIRQKQTGRMGAADDTVLSKITTKRSFTVLWHLSVPPLPRLYLLAVSCGKRGGRHTVILWWVNVIMRWNAAVDFTVYCYWIILLARPAFEGCTEGTDKEAGTATTPKQRFKSVTDALEIIFTTVVYPEFYFVFKALALVV